MALAQQNCILDKPLRLQLQGTVPGEFYPHVQDWLLQANILDAEAAMLEVKPSPLNPPVTLGLPAGCRQTPWCFILTEITCINRKD
jgi:hypothetical protein